MASSAHGLLVDDVVREILFRLPSASVLRFRAVCKHWRRITTCPVFLAIYSLRQPLELLAYPYGYKMGGGSQNVLAAVNLVSSGARCTGLVRVDSQDGLLLLEMERGGRRARW